MFTNPDHPQRRGLPCVMRSFFALALFPMLGLCDTVLRDDCWCRNATHTAWTRILQLESTNIPGPMPTINQWCIDETPDGRGECLDWHTKQYTICASYQALGDKGKRNDYCYKNHGNSRGLVPHFSKGPDTISKFLPLSLCRAVLVRWYLVIYLASFNLKKRF